MDSYWEKNYWFEPVDFTIVGSGLVGLLTAIFIKKKYPKAKVQILEAYAIPKGASTRNAGFACFGSVGELIDDLANISEETIFKTLKMRYDGLRLLTDTVPPSSMDYAKVGGKEVFLTKASYEACADNLSYLNALIKSEIGLAQTFRPERGELHHGFYDHIITNVHEGQLNPVLLVRNLKKQVMDLGVQIHPGIEIKEWFEDKERISVSLMNRDLELVTQHLILATNAFTQKLIPQLDIIPKRNQVLISKSLDRPIVRGTYHFDKGYVYFRNVDNNRLLIGGARNMDAETESTAEFGANKNIIDHLTEFSKKYLSPDFEIEDSWSGIIATGSAKAPYVEYVSERVIVAARMGGMGVAIGARVAEMVVNLISGKQDKTY